MAPPSVPAGPVVVVSPHLDDAVLSCGRLLFAAPGSTVVTVLAGRPAVDAGLTPWDAASGFAAGDDVVGARRAEDRAALACVDATPLWLDGLDRQYRPPGLEADPDELAALLEPALDRLAPATVLIPLGLAHPDHVAVAEAGLTVAARRARSPIAWLVYEEQPYRDEHPVEREARLAVLGDRGFAPVRARPRGRPGQAAARARALAAYPSQLLALGGRLGLAAAVDHLWLLRGPRSLRPR